MIEMTPIASGPLSSISFNRVVSDPRCSLTTGIYPIPIYLFIGGREHIRFAGILFTMTPGNYPIARRNNHRTFQRMNMRNSLVDIGVGVAPCFYTKDLSIRKPLLSLEY